MQCPQSPFRTKGLILPVVRTLIRWWPQLSASLGKLSLAEEEKLVQSHAPISTGSMFPMNGSCGEIKAQKSVPLAPNGDNSEGLCQLQSSLENYLRPAGDQIPLCSILPPSLPLQVLILKALTNKSVSVSASQNIQPTTPTISNFLWLQLKFPLLLRFNFLRRGN